MRFGAIAGLLAGLMLSSAAARDLKTCSGNRAYCEAGMRKHGMTTPQCAIGYSRCMETGEWSTSGKFSRSVKNVQRR